MIIYIYTCNMISSHNLHKLVWHCHCHLDSASVGLMFVHCPQEHKEKDPVRRSPGSIESFLFALDRLKPWGVTKLENWMVETMSFGVICQRLPLILLISVYIWCSQWTQFLIIRPSASKTCCNLFEAFPAALGAITGATHSSGFPRLKFFRSRCECGKLRNQIKFLVSNCKL